MGVREAWGEKGEWTEHPGDCLLPNEAWGRWICSVPKERSAFSVYFYSLTTSAFLPALVSLLHLSCYLLPAGVIITAIIILSRPKDIKANTILNYNDPSIWTSVNMWSVQILFFINHIFFLAERGRTELRRFHDFSVCYKETPGMPVFTTVKKQSRNNNDNSLVSLFLSKWGVFLQGYQRVFMCKILLQALWQEGWLSEWMIWVPTTSWLD